MAEKDAKAWSIIVKTGDHKGSGCDSNIFVAFADKSGKRSEDIKLDVAWRDDFERGKEDTFPCDDLVQNGQMEIPCVMEIWRDSSGIMGGWNWYCEVVILQTSGDNRIHFPVLRWVEPGYHYKIPLNDTSLPQDDPFFDQRKKELEKSREKYKLVVVDPNLPVQIEKLPPEEEFSDDVKRYISLEKRDTLLGTLTNLLDFRQMTKYEHMERLFKAESSLPKPKTSEFWQTDEWFGAQRLVGVNPMTIKLCTEIPDSFAVTDEVVGPFIEGMTLQKALEEKKLFIVDYSMANGVKLQQGFYLCSPLALFFVNNQKKLMPIAIQLYHGKHNPIFTPGIDKHKWNLVKMWFNLVDVAFHQPCYHLGLTHLAMEGIVIAVHRCLAKNHPVFRLLAPHFIYLLAIKNDGLKKLLSEKGFMNKLLSVGVEGGFQLLSRLWIDWKIDVGGTLPAELENRGVADPSILPEFPYRDDGMLVYNAIKKYVTDIVNIYYESENKIVEDTELQHWGKLVSTSAKEGGVGIQGIPNGGVFKKTDDIVLVCTAVIFTCSAQHAAVNFGQYDAYSFIPSYPSKLRGQPPTNTDPITEEDVMNALADKSTMCTMLLVSKVLSAKGTNSLGDWEVRWQYDPRAIEAEGRFREELQLVSEEIKKRNAKRSEMYQYPYLDPENIPNAISI